MDFHNVTKETIIIAACVAVLVIAIVYLIKTFFTRGYTPKLNKEIDRLLDEKEGEGET